MSAPVGGPTGQGIMPAMNQLMSSPIAQSIMKAMQSGNPGELVQAVQQAMQQGPQAMAQLGQLAQSLGGQGKRLASLLQRLGGAAG